MMTPRTSEEVLAMASSDSGKFSLPSSRTWLFLLAIPLVLGVVDGAEAGDMQRMDAIKIGSDRAPGPLDGQSFKGEFGRIGEPAHDVDTWVFKDGSFWSENCLECGFPRSVYLTESGSGAVDFRTVTNCPVSDARIIWEGTVDDGRIEGIFTWTKKRWYRTVRKQYWFKGTLEEFAAGLDKKDL